MRSFTEEFKVPLNEVQRHWIRIPCTLILTPVVLLVAFAGGAMAATRDMFYGFTMECLKGPGSNEDKE